MKRSLWVVAFLIVVIGFAGFQQYQSWSLNKPQSSAQTTSEGSGSGDSGQARSTGGQAQGRAGGRARGETVPVLVATAVQKSVPIADPRRRQRRSLLDGCDQEPGDRSVINKAHFKEGQDVKKDQLLFTIDPRPFDAALKQAEANLARDNAQLSQLARTGPALRRIGRQRVCLAASSTIRFKPTRMPREAVVEADKAAVDNAKVQLSYCYIYSPVSGRVGSFLVNEGNLVRVNDGAPLVVINQISPIIVTFAVPEQNLADLKRHMASGKLLIDASFPSDEGRPEQGRLGLSITPSIVPPERSNSRRVFSNEERRLWPGQFVNVGIDSDDPRRTPSSFHRKSIQVGPEGQQVFVVEETNGSKSRPVTVGQTQRGRIGDHQRPRGRRNGRARRAISPRSWRARGNQGPGEERTTAAKGEGSKGRAKSKTKARRTRCVMNISGSLHTSAGHDHAGDARDLIFGVLGYKSLPVSDLPTVDFPTITVNANLAGASAETMASSVATPLEKNFSTIAGLDSMSSTSTLGRTQITLQFTLSRNVDAAAQDVQAMIARTARDLPPNMPSPPSYRKVNPANNSIMLLALTSDTLPLSTVDEFAQTILAQRISMVSGVAQVDVLGSQKYAVRVQLDPNQLAVRQIGIDDVVAAVQRGNVDLPVGTLNAPNRAYTLVSDGQLINGASLSTDGRHLPQRRAGAHSRHRHGDRQRREQQSRRAGSTTKGPSFSAFSGNRAPTSSKSSTPSRRFFRVCARKFRSRSNWSSSSTVPSRFANRCMTCS